MTTNATLERTTTSRAVTITLWVAQAALALLFLSTAYAKFTGDPAQVAIFGAIGAGQWLRYVAGVLELAGAVGLLVPRLAGFSALGLLGVMAGAVLYHLVVTPPASAAAVPAVIGVVLAGVAYARRAGVVVVLRGRGSP